MKRFFLNADLQLNKSYKIENIEHNHIKNVMRMSVGDKIIIVNGNEFDYTAEIIDMTKGHTLVKILEKTDNVYNPKANVTVFQALVKSDNMALIVQKLTELGVTEFVPFESEFITSKDKFGKANKLQEISNQSIKQCKRSIPMQVSSVHSFNQMLNKLDDYDTIVFANECEDTQNLNEIELQKNQKVAIIVGSEGGFSVDEIAKIKDKKAHSITLGKRILRAETCAISLTSVVMFIMGEWQ